MPLQKGFSLVELLVAMVVGLLVTLGAGQLFLSSFSSFQAVQRISQNQEAVVFVANTLMREIRENNQPAGAYSIVDDPDNEYCQLINKDGEVLIGGLYKDGESCGSFSSDEACEDSDGNKISGCNFFTLKLPRFEPAEDEVQYEEISFHVMQRQSY